ncbi:MAG: hypothetical protein IJX13_01380, partial [Clostridia bacterium]|nr:hypothetical protein [Clostridia bacterium]
SYTDAPVSLPYDTSFTVAFTMPECYKLVKWNGTSVVHTTAYTSASLVIGAADMTVTATILPVAVVPAVTPDYLPENAVLNFAADGEYVLSVQGMEDILVSLQNGAIRINGERADAFVIPEEYFGKTVSIVYKGDGVVHADSSPVTVAIVARPESPRPEVELDRIDDTDDRKLTVYMYDGLSYVYEFAISRTNDPTTITQWFSNGTGVYTFADLQPGTAYYIFIRTKATADAPHGQIYITRNPYYTPTKDYVDETVDDLNSLIGESDGDITSALIQGAIDQINQWASQQPLPDTFYQDVENLINRIKNEQLVFAQSQDAKIAALEAFLKECLASGAFTEAHQQALKDLCANAVTGITAGTTEEEIRQIFETTMVSMEMIPVTYRYDVNHIIQLISKLGLSQESKLTLIRLNDIEALKHSVQEAIRSGGVIRGNVELLKTLEVVAAYKFKLESVTAPDAEDVFTIRLTIPADLQNYTGLQIAYYVETANGITVEYIESRIEGNEIVFETDKVGDFVILADSTVDLTAIIIALGAILACQIIAIAVIMITRFNAKKKITDAKHYSFMLPAFLAVHFLPVGGETLALLMGAAVILLQVILMILLLKSDIIHLGKKKKQEPTDEEAAQSDNNAYSAAETEPLQPVEEQPVEDSEEARIAAFLYGNEDAEQKAEESDPYADDPFAAYDDAEPTAEEVYAEEAYATEDEEAAETFGEDFIEPAANPYYSLPEDEAGETEQLSEETETDPYDEESTWDDRPYDEEYATEEYTDEYANEYTEEYADEQPLGEAVAEDFSLEDDFDESYDAMMGNSKVQDQDLIDADTEAYASDYVEEEPYDEGSFEDAYVQEFYSDEAAPEEAPVEELSYAEEEYTEEPVFEAPVYEPDEAAEDTDPMYRYDE